MLQTPPPPRARWTLPMVACLSSLALYAEPNSVEELAAVRSNLSQALSYRDQAAKEQFAWELRRGEMENLILLSEEEKKNLEAAIAIARPILVDLQTQRVELTSRKEGTRIFADFLQSAGPSLAEKLLERSGRWPEPLLADAREPLQQIRSILDQEVDVVSDHDLGKLIRSTVETLEKALQFQNKIHHSSALHTLPDGREAHFEVVFIGLSGGYYFSDDLNLAGRIVSRSDGWEWVPQVNLVEPMHAFVETLKKERPATWIQLPVGATTEETLQ